MVLNEDMQPAGPKRMELSLGLLNIRRPLMPVASEVPQGMQGYQVVWLFYFSGTRRFSGVNGKRENRREIETAEPWGSPACLEQLSQLAPNPNFLQFLHPWTTAKVCANTRFGQT